MTALVPMNWLGVSFDEDSLAVLSKARELDDQTIAVVFCDPDASALDELSRYGAMMVAVLHSEGEDLPPARLQAIGIASLAEAEAAEIIMASTSSHNVEMMGALSVRLRAGILWGLTDIVRRDDALVGLRLVHNDTEVAEFAWRSGPKLAILRPRALSASEWPVTGPAIKRVPLEPDGVRHAEVVSRTSTEGGGQSLAAANVVVAGGRGLEKPENLKLVEQLAQMLGGAPAVSLPLVEAGWAPRAMQVGQTGTIVKPQVYIACGISGQIQHRIGIEGAGSVIAINSDASAPIMNFCDIGLVGDVKELLPQLIDAINQRIAP